MSAVLSKIIVILLSIYVAIADFFGFTEVLITDPMPVSEVEIVDQGSINIFNESNDTFCIFDNYIEWELFRKTHHMKDCSFAPDKDFFIDYNLVILNVMIPDTTYSVKVGTVYEAGSNLILEYVRVSQACVGLTVISYNSVFVATSKKISDVNLKKLNDIHLPFVNVESLNDWFTIVEANPIYEDDCDIPNDTFTVFSDYESWSEYLDSGVCEFYGYADKINEEYFENNNLVVGIVGLGSPMSRLRINYPYENENTLELECYRVSQPGIYPAVEYYEAVFVEVGKEINYVNATVEDFDVPFVLDGSLPMI